MGASPSRLASTPAPTTPGSVEKPGFPRDDAPPQTRGHHSVDRLNRITAESTTRSSSSSTSVDISSIPSWQSKLDQDPTSRLAALTLHNTTIKESLRVRKSEVQMVDVFNTVVQRENRPITNQQSSGRCWLFASHNVIRNAMLSTLKIDSFQLSQSYPFFWDHLEKANWFLEQTLDLYDRPVDDRVFSTLKADPVGDGGQWDMAANLLRKYGAVPQGVYPESFNSSSTGGVDKLLTTKLRRDAIKLRALKKEAMASLQSAGLSEADAASRADVACRKEKAAMLEDAYRLLSLAAGAPPHPDEPFTWSYRNTAGKMVTIRSTPREFLRKYAPQFDVEGHASLVHDPRHKPNTLLTVDRLGNVLEGNPVRYINACIDELGTSAIKQLKAGLPVFFGCDVGQFSNSQLGIMDTGLYDFSVVLGEGEGMSKAERIEYGESLMTHAMCLVGVQLGEKGEPVRWRVENSWGPTAGKEGYFVMSQEWFREFVYQVVVKREFMRSELWDLFERGVDEKTTVLPIYDPLGALA
ncbi:peptidase C1B, bleomycin hydrolase [Jaminaea rosea]|uniref:Cysteine proteinase 1, mitochondrial n=1 Tax=Jaminaea rosea TaxID=1569628 RepID=A0A316UVD6_9BASI|nr:peptidase C1B, bleomycin hydrolase [Jaminaea rosea]PWN27873.1 peptidase C1B, bleomycin hydrolase [Jaminaea rosea]